MFLKYCRPPAQSAPEKEGGGGSGGGDGGGSRLGAAVLWRIEAMNEISRGLYRVVALAAGLPLPGQRSREELMLKCKEWLRIWGLRQLHSNMASAVREIAASTVTPQGARIFGVPLRSVCCPHDRTLPFPRSTGVLSWNGDKLPLKPPP